MIVQNECPYDKGVCGLDESFVCFQSHCYLYCDIYKAQHKDDDKDGEQE